MLQKVHVTYKGRALQRGGVTYKVCMLQRVGVTCIGCAQTYVRMETLSRTSLRTLVVMDILICRVKVTKNNSYIQKKITCCNPISKNDHLLQSCLKNDHLLQPYIEKWSPATILYWKLITCWNPISKTGHLLQSCIEKWSPAAILYWKWSPVQSCIKKWSPAAILYGKILPAAILYQKFITCCNLVLKIDHLLQSVYLYGILVGFSSPTPLSHANYTQYIR